MIVTINEAQEYLESFIRPTVFERFEGDKHLEDPLERMRVLLNFLGNPEKKFKSIQVTGTSGKGSTAYFIASILSKQGYKTGFTVSPHLQAINERIQVNMQPISDEAFITLVTTVQNIMDQIRNHQVGEPSYFEILVALAFLHFSQQEVDIAIVEVGLEGRYDATNVLDPLGIVLTNISKDHTELLGESEEEIFSEAASIIRKGEHTPFLVTGVSQPSLLHSIKTKVSTLKGSLLVLGEDIHYHIEEQITEGSSFTYRDHKKEFSDLVVSLKGDYQVDNASLALAALTSLEEKGFVVSEKSIREGLKNAHFPGRFEVVKVDNKTFILDGAHNEAKMHAFLSALNSYYPQEKIVYLLGFKKRKDISSMVKQLLEQPGHFIVTEFHKTADYARSVSMSIDELQDSFPQREQISYQANVLQALAEINKREEEVIVVTGSLYLVGEVRETLLGRS